MVKDDVLKILMASPETLISVSFISLYFRYPFFQKMCRTLGELSKDELKVLEKYTE